MNRGAKFGGANYPPRSFENNVSLRGGGPPAEPGGLEGEGDGRLSSPVAASTPRRPFFL